MKKIDKDCLIDILSGYEGKIVDDGSCLFLFSDNCFGSLSIPCSFQAYFTKTGFVKGIYASKNIDDYYRRFTNGYASLKDILDLLSEFHFRKRDFVQLRLF